MHKICLERQELFDVNMVVTMKVTVSGRFTEEQLTKAFEKANASFETLSMCITIDSSGNAFYKKCDKPAHRIFFGSYSLESLIQSQEKIRFYIEDGEFLKCFVSTDKRNETDIYFLLHHIGGDGKSLLYYIEAFLTALSGGNTEYCTLQLLDTENYPKSSVMSFIEHGMAIHHNRLWLKDKTVFSFSHMQHAYDHFWKTHETEVYTQELSPAVLKEKLSLCHDNEIGFTSLALSKIMEDTTDSHRIGIAVSDRLNGNKSMSNQVTGIPFEYSYKNNLSTLENAKEIDKIIKHKLNNPKLKYFIMHFENALCPTLIDAVNLECAGTFHSEASSRLCDLLGFGSKAQDISITNLTNMEIPVQYGDIQIKDLWFVPPVVSYGKNIVGMITVNGKLNVTFHRYKKATCP